MTAVGILCEMTGAPIMTFSEASLGYKSEAVLQGVNLEIRAGDFVGLAGPNGSGKTTLLKSMLGVLPLRSGMMKRSFPLVNLGYVPQTASLDSYFPLSVGGVVAMGAYGRIHPFESLMMDLQREFPTFYCFQDLFRPFR